MKKIFALIMITILLQGCLGKRNEIKQDAVFLHSIPVCSTDKMCNEMWQTAEQWVDRYSPQGIDVIDDNLIRSELKELGSYNMDIEVNKVKLANGHYKIVIDNICSSSFSSCDLERSNMIAFNKELIKFMSKKQQAVKEKVFIENFQIKDWFEKYAEFVGQRDPAALSGLLHFPVNYIDDGSITVLNNQKSLVQFLNHVHSKLAAINGKYLKSSSLDIFARTGRNSYVNVVLNVYDHENALVGAQQLSFHMVMIDKQWKMISAAVHGDE